MGILLFLRLIPYKNAIYGILKKEGGIEVKETIMRYLPHYLSLARLLPLYPAFLLVSATCILTQKSIKRRYPYADRWRGLR